MRFSNSAASVDLLGFRPRIAMFQTTGAPTAGAIASATVAGSLVPTRYYRNE
jgi:hypothetical protein